MARPTARSSPMGAACAASLVLSALVTLAAAFRTGDHWEPDAPPGGWYWGDIDANIDWCERNYDTTEYIAEFWNTISSIPIFLFALAGYIAGKRYAMAESRFSLAFFLMMLVGLGSTCFHATLRRYAQSMDELPMLWTSICLFYNAVDHAPPNDPNWVHPATSARAGFHRAPLRRQGKFLSLLPAHPAFQHRAGLKLVLLFSAIALTTIYFYIPGLFIIFFIGYSTFLMSFVFIMAFHIFFSARAERKNRLHAHSEQGYEAVQLSERNEGGDGISPPTTPPNGAIPAATDSPASTNGSSSHSSPRPYSPVLGKLFWLAIGGYFGGFVFWLYENTYCSSLPSWLQLHAVWHIMAGLGSFCTIQCQLAWRGEQLGGRTHIDMELGKKILPIVVIKYN